MFADCRAALTIVPDSTHFGGSDMKLRCTLTMNGPGPSEAIVSITTADGQVEEVVVDGRSYSNGLIEVGPLLAQANSKALIELPREAASGRWRIWVRQDALQPEMAVA